MRSPVTDGAHVRKCRREEHVWERKPWYLPDRRVLSFSCSQDKFPLIANCAILLFYINFSPTGYFSLLSGKHSSTWNYYCARASGETQTVVNLGELWGGLCSLDGQSTGGAEGPIPALYRVLRRHRVTFTSLASSWLAREKMAAIDPGSEERRCKVRQCDVSSPEWCFMGERTQSLLEENGMWAENRIQCFLGS